MSSDAHALQLPCAAPHPPGVTRARLLRWAMGWSTVAMAGASSPPGRAQPSGAASPPTPPSPSPSPSPLSSTSPSSAANPDANAHADAHPGGMQTRPIPSTGERLPVIGCGTWQGFDQDEGSEAYARLPQVLRALFDGGGRLLDSSPMYGRSEAITGQLLEQTALAPRAFLATKVWTRGRAEGIAQMEQSFQRLRTQRMDLMQVHNLVDTRTHLATLRPWKEQGRVRYVGVTHYTASAYGEVEQVLQRERLDFLQINYSLDAREAEKRLLPLAAERGVAVIVNLPFGGGGLLRRLGKRPLPAFAAEIGCTSWAQLLLKFVLSHPAVTCAIPGTSRPEHMADNLRAGHGPLPEAGFWRAHVGELQV